MEVNKMECKESQDEKRARLQAIINQAGLNGIVKIAD